MKLLIPFLAVLLLGCASTNKLGTAYVEAHPELEPETKRRIIAREAAQGMTAEQVVAAIGGPLDVKRNANGTEYWEYRSVILTFQHGILVEWVDKKYLY